MITIIYSILGVAKPPSHISINIDEKLSTTTDTPKIRTEDDFQKLKAKQRLAKSQAFQSGGAGAVNTALFIQNAVQLRHLLILTCSDPNDVDGAVLQFQECFTSRHNILFILINISLVFQVVYAMFIVTELCLKKQCGANELSNKREKQDKAMWLKTFGAIAALLVALINMFISGFTN